MVEETVLLVIAFTKGLVLAPFPPPMTVPNQAHMETPVAQVMTITQLSLRTAFFFLSFFTLKLIFDIFVSSGCSELHLSMKKGMEDRYVSRGPGSEPVKGAPRRPTGSSRRDRHHQLPPGSSSRGSKIPPKGHTPATTATQPTTAGSAKRRPS
ncbi:hypothetical protein F5888DRAFT_394318 [Russula emetica]|nr:hypothetical protein F5888DRAFT_394318 [Russula emetica]